MVATAAGLVGISAHIPADKYDNHSLWPRYEAIPQIFLDVLKGEEVRWVPEEAY